MKIWLTRHGQTNLNKKKLMQGLTDEPLNAHGIEQAHIARRQIGDVRFDAVFASPLDRAIVTGSIIGNCPREEIHIDERLIEADFGKYEKKSYYALGPAMTLYWAFPEIFPVPDTVESARHIAQRSAEFLRELEQMEYDNVLIAAHGGVMRGLNGYLLDRRNGLRWRPKMHNCEIRVYESAAGVHHFLKAYPRVK